MGLTPMSVYVTMLVIGGLGTATGPILGTILVQIVATLLVTHPGAEFTILGLFLLVVVVFVPDGLAGLIGRYWRRVAVWAAEDEQVTTEADGGTGETEGSPDEYVA
jgi:branched-chain amino acid transport system permease protein